MTKAMAENGMAVVMDGEKQPYKIMARDERYVILCRPFNLRRTYTYSFVDLVEGVRGPSNYIFGLLHHTNTRIGALRNLVMLRKGKQFVSHRRNKPLSQREMDVLSCK
jgi:hypothetical protein